MVYKIVISDEAKLNFQDQYLYYKEVANKKTADNFAKAFNSAIQAIAKNPYFQIWFDVYRALPLKGFPHLVFYYIETSKNTIVISRIFHTSQNPKNYPQKK